MARARFTIPISIVLFLAFVLAGTYFVRRQILRRHFRSALQAHDEQAVRRLLHAWPRPADPKGEDKDLFIDVVDWGSPELAAELADHGFDPLVWTVVSTLHKAAGASNLPMVKFLVGRGADVNGTAFYSRTPLHRATESPGVAAFLIRSGSRVDARDKLDETALHSAGNAGVIRVLVSAGADVNARDHLGRTPLYHAARILKLDRMRALLGSGADPAAKDVYGMTPLQVVRRQDPYEDRLKKVRRDAIDLLLQHGAKE